MLATGKADVGTGVFRLVTFHPDLARSAMNSTCELPLGGLNLDLSPASQM